MGQREPARAQFRFYAELNDHLVADQRHKPLEKSFFVPGPVKDMIESFGVPHTEVELIVVDGRSVDFSYEVRNGDRIAIYPMFESIDVSPGLKVRPEPLRVTRFVLDVHLGRLAAYLRMLGFDTAYRSCAADPELARMSVQERRILLTRDRGLLKRSAVEHGYWLRETDSRLQAQEVVQRFDLTRSIRPFTRCLACNGALQEAQKETVQSELPPRIAELHHDFQQCPRCGRVYWKGSHYRRMQAWTEAMCGQEP
jgi:uncharacterized protein